MCWNPASQLLDPRSNVFTSDATVVVDLNAVPMEPSSWGKILDYDDPGFLFSLRNPPSDIIETTEQEQIELLESGYFSQIDEGVSLKPKNWIVEHHIFLHIIGAVLFVIGIVVITVIK